MTCGPAVAVMAGTLLDPAYASVPDVAWFAAEQGRVHAAANRVWPRALGTTPWGMAALMSRHGVRYGWRWARGRETLADVRRAVRSDRPVALLIGNVVPRHWVLVVGCDDVSLDCWEPSSGEVRRVPAASVSSARLGVLGFPRAFAFVLPHSNI